MPKLLQKTPKLCRDRQQAYLRVDGQRIQLGRWGTPEAREAYDRVVAEWLSNGRKLPPRAPADEPVSVTMLVVEFMRYVERRHHPNEQANYRSALRIVRRLYGSEAAENFGPRALGIVRDQMVETGWARSHVNKQVSRVRAMFRWGVAQEMVEWQVYQRLRTLDPLPPGSAKSEGRHVQPVSRRHVRLVRPHLSRQVRALINLQLLTGARADELVRLRPQDINTTNSIWSYSLGQHKTAHHGKSRLILFGPRAQRVLQLFMHERSGDRPLFSPREAETERYAKCRWHGKRKPPRTGRTLGESYTTTSYRNAIYNACRKAGITKWSPHMLRHAAGTAIRERFGIEHAQAVLGHASLKVTEMYARVSVERARQVAQQVG